MCYTMSIMNIKIEKAFKQESVNIVFATNDDYACYMAVALKSLLDNRDVEKLYDIIILESNVTNENMAMITSMCDSEKVSIRFVNSDDIYETMDTSKLFCHLHFSKEMYLRLFIPQIMPTYKKVIYLDCDTLITGDISKLMDVDLGSDYVAAVRDYNTIVNFRAFPNVKTYFSVNLKLKDINNYVNSGVLLMNIPEMLKIDMSKEIFDLLDYYKEFLYPDQDILNLICEDKIKIIPNSWNYVVITNTRLIQDDYFKNLAVEFVQGIANQYVIHFLSEIKPWKYPNMYYGHIWWDYAKKTPFLQILITKFREFEKFEQENADKRQKEIEEAIKLSNEAKALNQKH